MEIEQAIDQFGMWFDTSFDMQYIPCKSAMVKAYEALKAQKSLIDYINYITLYGNEPNFKGKNKRNKNGNK